MATVTGVTKDHADSIEDQIISEAKRQGTSLIFTTKGGAVLNIPNAFPAPFEYFAVGQIYMTDRSANPSTYLGGGTWARWGKGKVPVGVDEADGQFDAVEETGGAKTHRLTVAEMPSHAHGGWTGTQDTNHTHDTQVGHNESGQHDWAYIDGAGRTLSTSATMRSGENIQDHRHSIPSEGGGGEHNNLQPYITVYMWKRTA